MTNEEKIKEENFKNLFQLGFFTNHEYHREGNKLTRDFNTKISSLLANTVQSNPLCQLYILDTVNIDSIFPLQFNPIDIEDQSGATKMKDILIQHLHDNTEDPLGKNLTKGILFDLSKDLGQLAYTDGDQKKEAEFNEKFDVARKKIDTLIDSTIDEIKKSDPSIFNSKDDEERIKNYIKKNIITVCRIPIKDFGAIITLPLFETKSSFELGDLIKLSGLRMGAVSLRKNVNEFLSIDKLINIGPLEIRKAEYSVPGSQLTVYFPSTKSVTGTNLFTEFERKMEMGYLKSIGNGPANLQKSITSVENVK